MLLDDVLVGLLDVRNGEAAMTTEQADTVLDAIYLLMEQKKVTEEKLAYYKNLEREGRLRVAPPASGKQCGTCGNYDQVPGVMRGHCMVRKDRYNQKPLPVGRSRKACKDYEQKKE